MPTSLSRFEGRCATFLWRHFVSPRYSTLQSTKTPQGNGSGILDMIRVDDRQRLASVLGDDVGRDLVYIRLACALWHNAISRHFRKGSRLNQWLRIETESLPKIESGNQISNLPMKNKTETSDEAKPLPEMEPELFLFGNGKIARLYSDLRRQINLRIYEGQPGSVILPWLNGLPEVKKIIDEQFGGVPISDANLSQWRKRGFRIWLANFERRKPTFLSAVQRMIGEHPAKPPRG
jgi:hypothetical protein